MPSVLVTDRSAWGVSVSVSLALTGVPPGGVALAVLTSEPVADGSTSTVKRKVAVAPTGRLTVVDRAPLPLRGPLTLPPPVAPRNVQVAAVTPGGSGSDSAAPVASLGPAFPTVIVYVVLVPGTAVVCPSSLVMTRP